MKSFNSVLFNRLKNANYAHSNNGLDSVLNVLNQKSDGSRKACINHNCRLAEMPFCWDYRSYSPSDGFAEGYDKKIRVLTFPMTKISTGWRFYLDVEESGALYISEGKSTRRTRVNLSILNDLAYTTRKEIYDTIMDLCFTSAYDGKSYSPFEFLKRRGETPNHVYSYIESTSVPIQTDVLEIYGFKHKTSADCELVAPVKINRYNDVLYVGKVEEDSMGKYRRVTILKDGDLVKDIETLRKCGGNFAIRRDDRNEWAPEDSSFYDGFSGLSGKEIRDWFRKILDDDKDYFVSRHECRKTTRKWSEIREMSRPRIFVMDKSTEGLCHHFYDDVEEIDLDDDVEDSNGDVDMAKALIGQIRFENDHSDKYESDEDED